MKIGTIGTGTVVDTFLNAVQEIEHVECTAMYTRKEETAWDLARKFKVKQIYTDYNAMLADINIDFIYIASPNSLHFEYAKKALHNGKNVICEKPFTSTVKEAEILIDIAMRKNLFLFEAITTIHLPNYYKIKKLISSIGDMKLVQLNFSQYSSRYDKLLAGEVTNAFDPVFSGGALVDINIYNLHFVTGLFGQAEHVTYQANIAENGIDTSGIVLLKYNGFICECVGAKDSYSPGFVILQGTEGYIRLQGSSPHCLSFEVVIGDSVETYNDQLISNRMVYEIINFEEMYHNRNYKKCFELLQHSLRVVKTAVMAREDAGIIFDADYKIRKSEEIDYETK